MVQHERTIFPDDHMAEVVEFPNKAVRGMTKANQRPRTYETAAVAQQAERDAPKNELAALAIEHGTLPTPPTDIEPFLLAKNQDVSPKPLPEGVECKVLALPLLISSDQQELLVYENHKRVFGNLENVDGVRRTDHGNLVIHLAPIF